MKEIGDLNGDISQLSQSNTPTILPKRIQMKMRNRKKLIEWEKE